MSYPARIKGGWGLPPAAPSPPRGGPPSVGTATPPPPQTPSIALARANKTGCEIGGGDGRGLPLPPLRAAPPHPPIQTPPSRPALGTCARVAAADSPLATRPQPTPPHPPQPRFCPTGRRVRAVRVPPVALWLARSGRAVWWALCPRLSLPLSRGRVRFSPPPPVLVCLRARRRAVVVARGGGCSSGFLPLFGLLLLWAVAACTRSRTVAPAPVCDVTVLYRCAR